VAPGGIHSADPDLVNIKGLVLGCGPAFWTRLLKTASSASAEPGAMAAVTAPSEDTRDPSARPGGLEANLETSSGKRCRGGLSPAAERDWGGRGVGVAGKDRQPPSRAAKILKPRVSFIYS